MTRKITICIGQGNIFLMCRNRCLQQFRRQRHKARLNLAQQRRRPFDKPGNILQITAKLAFINIASLTGGHGPRTRQNGGGTRVLIKITKPSANRALSASRPVTPAKSISAGDSK